MNTKTDFNSQIWFPDIKILADEFFEFADKNFVSYNGIVIDDIKREYPSRLQSLKEGIYAGEDLAKSRIDRHKVIALYIQLCLERQVFKLPPAINTNSGVDVKTMLINEMFCLRFTKNTLEEIGRAS
ncbi:MAG: hypothetical protein LBB56_05605, partial [Chitinispirillales bacterium]|nr:hypothetical protein [Chitinispirillales bacterium]